MLDINPETVRFIIGKAHEFQTDDGATLGEDVLSPFATELPDTPTGADDNPTTQEFNSIIGDLEPDQQQTVVALMWLGRGDFSLEEWEDAVSEARENWTLHTADYLLSTPLLADYLEEGLALHGYDAD